MGSGSELERARETEAQSTSAPALTSVYRKGPLPPAGGQSCAGRNADAPPGPTGTLPTATPCTRSRRKNGSLGPKDSKFKPVAPAPTSSMTRLSTTPFPA